MTSNSYTTIQVVEKKLEDAAEDLEQPFDDDFWSRVEKKFNPRAGISWNRAMDEVRVERLMAKHGKDTLLVIIRDWPTSVKYKDKEELVASLEYLISRFTEIVLERDSDEEYRLYRVEEDPARPTLLHLAVEWNFLRVTKLLVEKYPPLLYTETQQVGKKMKYLPVEKALISYNDKTAAYLISQMKPDRVHDLFLYNDVLEEAAKFSFGHIISHKNPKTGKHDMKKTVTAVLDRLVIPHWPYMPETFQELQVTDRIERACRSVPDDPLNYYFWYHVLDADDQGRRPWVDEPTVNNMFNLKSMSCLRLIADSEDKEAIQHPVVRMLVTRKWKQFGHWWFCVQALLYIVFLTMLSYALIYGSTQDNPKQYSGKANGLRLICEVLSIIFLLFYLSKEIDQAGREWRTHLKDLYNYLDCLGLILTILVIPLRFAEINSQWSVAGVGYLFNFLRLFKFSCLSSTTGLYTKTLAKVVYRDMSRFSVVFVIVFLGFCGALFMALKSINKQDMYLNYSWLMLAAVRALVEQQPIEEDYSKFNWLAILIILAYMALVTVILLNVLVAQLSYTYSEAKSNAKLQFAIDRIVIVTRLEHSRFQRFNLRVRYHIEGERVSEGTLAEEILEYSSEQNPWETMEEKLTLIRDLMRKVVRKMIYCR
ncbi:transient receptor potential cation channel subfamily V member 5-like [Montipora capricornis]|uniref:transient receptor potential cation channel subfamily V member 5-like n=1 Tax=Montipora capricornis TaxID=246305 RepID=UPI0035F191A2